MAKQYNIMAKFFTNTTEYIVLKFFNFSIFYNTIYNKERFYNKQFIKFKLTINKSLNNWWTENPYDMHIFKCSRIKISNFYFTP